MTTYLVRPIDIDFAVWTVVEAGEHNAWGVIEDNPHGQILIGHCAVKGPADYAVARLNEDQPEHPRFWFLNYRSEWYVG